MKTFLITIMILSVFVMIMPKIKAENPDGKGYFEPRFIMGAGVGNIADNQKLELKPFGIGFKLLTPINDRISLFVSGDHVWRGRYNPEPTVNKLRLGDFNRFRFEIGLRFYLK